MKKSEHSNPNRLSVGKVLIWQTRLISAGAVAIIMGYLSLYCTNTLGMPAILVGTLLMASKIFDGVTDLVAGWLVDNTNTKWGKGRPYELCIIGLWVCTYALFSISDKWSLVGKSVWIFIMYTLIFSVFQTLLNAAETPYIIRAFGTKDAVTKVSAYGGIIITFGCMVVSTTFPILVAGMGTSVDGWRKLMLFYSIPLLALGILRFFFIKEDKPVGDVGKDGEITAEKVSFKEIFILLKTNRFVWLCAVAITMPKLCGAMSAGTYYFSEVVGNLSAYSGLQLFSVVILIFMVVFPALMKKYSAMQLVGASAAIGIMGYVLNYFAGANMKLLILACILYGISSLPASYMKNPIIMQISDYNEMRGEKRMEATVASVINFLEKIGNALGTLLIGVLLTVGAYDGTAAVQPESALFMIRLSYSLIPAAFMVVVIICCVAFRPLDRATNSLVSEKENANE